NQSQIGFMNQGSRLEGVALAFARHMTSCGGTQFGVHERYQLLQSVFVALAPSAQKTSNLARRCTHNLLQLYNLVRESITTSGSDSIGRFPQGRNLASFFPKSPPISKKAHSGSEHVEGRISE